MAAAEHRAVIHPLPGNVYRPLWSVMIPTYNSAHLLRATLESVLAQDPGPQAMQIEVVDDGSDDDPAEVVRQAGRGRVGFHRQPRNVGQIANFTTCLNRSTGRLIHLLHGDDRVRPGFYETLQEGFSSDASVGAAFCRWSLIDENSRVLLTAEAEENCSGILPNALERLASEQRITTPSIVVRRSVWETLGGFDSRLRCAEDWEMWVRIAAHYAVWYDPRPLAEYRIRSGSTTHRNHRLGDELRFTAQALKLFSPLLPAERRRAIQRAAGAAYASTALKNARTYALERDYKAMFAHLAAALSFSSRPKVIGKAALIALRGIGAKK